ncbi:forkhead box protein E1-like [Rhinolophus ferrumequinum]|uniref:forkhead box protein E1-like n=1 Tax=Rhinolophus ferrumequinum TaxID=59479 RepID=UPI00140FC497|nr:forkhead box protein E1-like [Rhinolophus ferrumequinum]
MPLLAHRGRRSLEAGTVTSRRGRAHSPSWGPTGLAYAHPALAPLRGAQSRCGPAAGAEWGARGALAAPGRAEPNLSSASPALRPAWPGRPRPPPGPARQRRSSPARLQQPKLAAPGGNTASCASTAAAGERQNQRRSAAPARPMPPGPACPTRATASGEAPHGTLGVVVRAARSRPAAEARPGPGRERYFMVTVTFIKFRRLADLSTCHLCFWDNSKLDIAITV